MCKVAKKRKGQPVKTDLKELERMLYLIRIVP